MKFAVMLAGLDSVTVVEALDALATGPLQLTNWKPLLADAETGTDELASKNPLLGVTTPPFAGDDAVVSWYCVLKFAVSINGAAPTVIECEAAPSSLQDVNKYRVPAAPDCVVTTEIVCEPCDRFKT